jgi:hypothetical protein
MLTWVPDMQAMSNLLSFSCEAVMMQMPAAHLGACVGQLEIHSEGVDGLLQDLQQRRLMWQS